MSAQSLKGNPYDAHTLESTLAHTEKMTQRKPKNAYCDQGYKGHGVEGETKVVICERLPKQATRAVSKWMKRRAAIEPMIGYLKSDNRLSRNDLKDTQGNSQCGFGGVWLPFCQVTRLVLLCLSLCGKKIESVDLLDMRIPNKISNRIYCQVDSLGTITYANIKSIRT